MTIACRFVLLCLVLLAVSPASAQVGQIPGFPPIQIGSTSKGLQTNLTAFWSMETTSWTDDTGNGSTLTGGGTPASSSTAPVPSASTGNYLALDGASSLSITSNSNILSGGSSFSVQAWVYVPSAGGAEVLYNKNSNAFGQKEWGLGTAFATTNKWSFRVYNTSSNFFDATGTTTVATNTWVHLVGTYDSASKVATLYVNGAQEATVTISTGTLQSSASAPIHIGAAPNGTVDASGTRIDQVGFWKGRVLSSGDVTALSAGLSYAQMF